MEGGGDATSVPRFVERCRALIANVASLTRLRQEGNTMYQQGHLQRTPRGRVATAAAFRHLGVVPPKNAGELFNE